jgi:hypothetical protein
MAKQIHERLFSHARPFQTSSLGPSIEDISKIPLTEEVLADLKLALESTEFETKKVGLFFSQGLLQQQPPDPRLVPMLLVVVADCIRDEDGFLRNYAVPVLVLLRGYVSDYRTQMLTLLRDSVSAVRHSALMASETFLKPGEVAPLLPFQSDTSISETEAMGGPWRYLMRDEALYRIERLLQRDFRVHECSEVRNNQVIFWWDWVPFLKWWAKRH